MICVALAATTLAATPSFAQTAPAATFTGPRVGVNVGFADDKFLGTEAFTYGLDAGYDVASGGTICGVTAEIEDSKDLTRALALTGRIGARVGTSGLVYATAGYSNLKDRSIEVDGVRLGLGGELSFGKAYVKAEQRFGNYQYGLELYQTVIGAGIRF